MEAGVVMGIVIVSLAVSYYLIKMAIREGIVESHIIINTPEELEKRKKKKSNPFGFTGQIESVTCPYCNKVYNAHLDKCPHCGR